jgi:hypothetical protein
MPPLDLQETGKNANAPDIESFRFYTEGIWGAYTIELRDTGKVTERSSVG